ncbi:hypothetical protein NJB1808e29_41050, partial [Mycobacterium marinum]
APLAAEPAESAAPEATRTA